jgi:hypothetical protein
VTATPDGRGYIVSGSQYTHATLGQPLVPSGAFLLADPIQAANGIVGIYERVTSFENLSNQPLDKKIDPFDESEYLKPIREQGFFSKFEFTKIITELAVEDYELKIKTKYIINVTKSPLKDDPPEFCFD